MELITQFNEAFANLIAAKLRSFLAILGILVGTASVVALISGGELATAQALEQFKSLGTDLLAVNLMADKPGSENAASKPFASEDANALKNLNPAILDLAAYAIAYAPSNYAGVKIKNTGIIGAPENLQSIIKIQLAKGRFVSFLDQYAYFCVIGDNIYQALLSAGVSDPIGKQLQLGKAIFTIIGVAQPWPENAFFNNDINRAVIVPLPTTKFISKNADVSNIIIRLKPDADLDAIQNMISQYLNDNFKHLKPMFLSPKEILNSMMKQQDIFTWLLGLIGSISLLVGGIGVMNIMLVSVVERRREIGIRMAVGAKRRDIQLLFLLESVTLTVFGGILGISLGVLLSYLIAKFAGWEFHLLLTPPIIGFVVSVATGIFFGFYPAYQASQLDPIQTLRAD